MTASREWDDAKRTLLVGSIVDCLVITHRPFGVFVHITGSSIVGLIERICMNHGTPAAPIDYPQIGSHVRAVVLGFRDWSHQAELALLERDSMSG